VKEGLPGIHPCNIVVPSSLAGDPPAYELRKGARFLGPMALDLACVAWAQAADHARILTQGKS